MKTVLLLCSLAISVNIYSQAVSAEKKNAANSKTVTSGTNPLYKANAVSNVQVQSQLNVQDDAVGSYQLNFTANNLQPSDNNSSSSNTCSVKDEHGIIYNGEFQTMSSSASGPHVYACKFSKDAFYKIIALKITDFKIITADGKGGSFSIDKKHQGVISEQAKEVLKKFKPNNPD